MGVSSAKRGEVPGKAGELVTLVSSFLSHTEYVAYKCGD